MFVICAVYECMRVYKEIKLIKVTLPLVTLYFFQNF